MTFGYEFLVEPPEGQPAERSGTIGVFLRGARGKLFAVTSGHVIKRGERALHSSTHEVFGECIFSKDDGEIQQDTFRMDIAVLIITEKAESELDSTIKLEYNGFMQDFKYNIGRCDNDFAAFLLKDEQFNGKKLYEDELRVDIDNVAYNFRDKPYKMIYLYSSETSKCTIQRGDSGLMVFNRTSPDTIELYGMIIGYVRIPGQEQRLLEEVATSTSRLNMRTIGVALPLSAMVDFVPSEYELKWDTLYTPYRWCTVS